MAEILKLYQTYQNRSFYYKPHHLFEKLLGHTRKYYLKLRLPSENKEKVVIIERYSHNCSARIPIGIHNVVRGKGGPRCIQPYIQQRV